MKYDSKDVWICEQSADRAYRFLQGKRGAKTLICCGVNRSTASPEDLDPTMKRVEAIAKYNGYDGYVMINLYPMRAADPKDVDETANAEMVARNLHYIEELFAVGKCDIWAAWGNIIEMKKCQYLKDCLKQIVSVADKYDCTWYFAGKITRKGNPYHPLYLRHASKLQLFDVHTYLKSRFWQWN